MPKHDPVEETREAVGFVAAAIGAVLGFFQRKARPEPVRTPHDDSPPPFGKQPHEP